ncbi:unnamed protein product [Thelazia callipaeda]|uniref:Inhibitor of growth protein n=1 Tax=Thelazia callipaeda TaxID=103827 RepID=A0A0N5D309_THECL|nr:unnamed protein product [Thelazia callipaeda]
MLEQFLSELSTLPKDLAKNLSGIRKYDKECQKRSAEIDQKLRIFVDSCQKMTKNSAVSFNKEIMALFDEIERLSNEKIRLASDTYELVDKHIRHLDNESVKLQALIKQRHPDVAAQPMTSVTAGNNDEVQDRKRKWISGRRSKKKIKDDIWAQKDKVLTTTPLASLMEESPVMEMPVDPDEPTYCTCQQVSHGQMIMCDNKQCAIEWFHFQCVGLTEAPKGKWFCERCSEQRKRKSSTVSR